MAAELAPIAHEAVEQANVLGTLGIDWKLFLAQLINVAIIILVLRTWVFKPLGKMLEDRKKKIEDGLKHAHEADQRLRSAKEQEEATMAEARMEARKIVEDSRGAGEKERLERVEHAKQEIDAQVADAKEKIVQERKDALETVRREVGELVMAATKKVSAGSIDEKSHREAIDQAITELEKAKV